MVGSAQQAAGLGHPPVHTCYPKLISWPAMLLAATADGALSLHDIRGGRGAGGGGQRGAGEGGARGGALCLGTAACGAPLRCCAADGRLALAGDESGAVQLWDVGRVAGGTAAVRQGMPRCVPVSSSVTVICGKS